jgi:hypothetical protein
MSPYKKKIWQYRSLPEDRLFLQPIAVAIVCAGFIALILIMGVMDLQRSNRILEGFMQNQAMSVTGVVQRLSQDNLNNLVQAFQRDRERSYVPLKDAAFSPQKMLTIALADLGLEIDEAWKAGRISDEYLQKFAVDKGLWMVAVLNARGGVVYQSRSLPEGQTRQRSAVKIKETEKDIGIGLFTQLFTQIDFYRQAVLPASEVRSSSGVGRKDIPLTLVQTLDSLNIGYIGLKRRDGSGTILIAQIGRASCRERVYVQV